MWLIALNWTWPRQPLPLGSLEDEQMDHEEGPEGGVRALRPGPAVQPWPPRSSAHVLLREGSAHVSAAVSKRVLLGAFAKVTPRLGKSGREAVISRSAFGHQVWIAAEMCTVTKVVEVFPGWQGLVVTPMSVQVAKIGRFNQKWVEAGYCCNCVIRFCFLLPEANPETPSHTSGHLVHELTRWSRP